MEVIEGGKKPFAPGDVVAMKSGGMPMTIMAVRETDGYDVADLRWMATAERIASATVPIVCLQAYTAAPQQRQQGGV